MRGTSNAFGTNASGRFGVYELNEVAGYIIAGEWYNNPGQAEFLAPGTYTWVCPDGITSVSAVCVGGGGGGYQTWASAAGSGGGLGWKNNIAVSPGLSYTVVVGSGGIRQVGAGGNSYFIDLNTVAGYGGGNVTAGLYTGGPNQSGAGGGYVGDGGGAGGSALYTGGGGAGGYAGNGASSQGNAQPGGGGAGGGYSSSTYGTGAGGGVGVYGQRTDYNAQYGYAYGSAGNNKGTLTLWLANRQGLGGQGGSQRTGIISGQVTGYHGCNGENPWGFGYNANAIQGGFPGGGGGGPGTQAGGGRGGDGAVRIIWSGEIVGVGRAYPTTDVEDAVV